MSNELNEHKEQVFKWLEIAEEDLRLAKFAFKMESNIPYRLIGYHCQQCAEKYLKAFLVSKMIDFPYTHNIEVLTNISPPEYDLYNKLSDTFQLSNYATAKRYPGEYRNLSKEDAEMAVLLAEKARSIIGELLRNDGFEFME